MDFSIMLDEKMDEFDTMVAERSLKSKRSSESSLRPDKNNVDLEMEVMSIAETEARFNALTELTGRYFSGLKNVIREGR
jgi:flagellar basal body rod protein FlgB